MTSPSPTAAALVWRIVAVDMGGNEHGDCGHNHATKAEATRCQWDPGDWRETGCDHRIKQVLADRVLVDVDLTIKHAKREHARKVLNICHGNMSEAARLLGVARTTLRRIANV